MSFESDELKIVFEDIISSFYFDKRENLERNSISLLQYQSAGVAKEFGKFVVETLIEDKNKFLKVFKDDDNSLNTLVNKSYKELKVLNEIKNIKEYTRIFGSELEELIKLMNKDFEAALEGRNEIISDLEFLLTYYVFIYLSQIAIRLDNDLEGNKTENSKVYFKLAKEPVSEDRECVRQGWKKVEKKSNKIFKHLIVLNMLNCHNADKPYLTYSGFYKIYAEHPEERKDMDDAIDYIINEYTIEHKYETDASDKFVDFSSIQKPQVGLEGKDLFKAKVKYLFNCVSFQLESKGTRKTVDTNVEKNYNYILKMRFVKSWGQLGNMLIISNEDLIRMIQICQRSTDYINDERGIQINDLFNEFDRRFLYFDGKTKQYIIDYLINANLIDSKCDSEEAQYVKKI